MPTIEPPKFTEGNFNPFDAAKSAITNASISGNRYGTKQAAKLQEQHHQNAMEQMNLAHTNLTQYSEQEHRQAMAQQTLGHEQLKELETHKAGLAAEGVQAQHQQALEAATHGAKLENRLAASTHKRNLELHNAIFNSSQGNTEVNVKFPAGGEVSYTAKGQQPTAVKEEAPAAPVAAPSSVYAAAAAATPAAKSEPKPEGPKPTVARGAGGKMVSLNPEAKKAKPSKKSAPGVPTVKKGPKGRFQSLKD